MERNARPGDLKELAFRGFFNLRFPWELGFGAWDLISIHGTAYGKKSQIPIVKSQITDQIPSPKWNGIPGQAI
jgi:hypothetical protein